MSSSMLSPTQRYAAGALFGLALHQAQIIQTCQFSSPSDNNDDDDAGPIHERVSNGSSSSSSDSVSDDQQLWVNPYSDLLRPVFKYLEIDSKAWSGLEETSACSPVNHHVGAFLRVLAEETGNATSSEAADKELALSRGVDAMASSMETIADDHASKKVKQQEYENSCREKCSTGDTKVKLKSEVGENQPETDDASFLIEQLHIEARGKLNEDIQKPVDKSSLIEQLHIEARGELNENIQKPVEELTMLSYQKKVAVLYELLSACLANNPTEDEKKIKRRRKGYDSRHRVALRLLATWFNVECIKMEAMETMVACSAMAILKEEESKDATQSPQSKWAKWKRGGIIGAAAVTGGALMAITGGLAAPAIAAGFGALAPTLGTLVPVIGAGGFAAVASAAGSVAGSVAVAASFGAAGAGLTGTKMARRMGDVDEFEFKGIGENHNQGRLAVEILISGFVFEEEDFVKPWEGVNDHLERYVLQWESKNLYAVSTAIQDWLTSKIATELMKQGAMLTVLSTLVAALAWPATLLAATSFIDSTWTIAIDRTDKAGILLAEVLLKGLQGNRPVTLVGFSLGARVIFKCLQTLAERDSGAELVERVVLLGAPIAIKDENWEAARKVVAGRFLNVYSTNDWMLGIAFRASLLTQGLAGIQTVDVPGIENVDATELIEGHSAYLWAAPHILQQLELDTSYPVLNRSVVKV